MCWRCSQAWVLPSISTKVFRICIHKAPKHDATLAVSNALVHWHLHSRTLSSSRCTANAFVECACLVCLCVVVAQSHGVHSLQTSQTHAESNRVQQLHGPYCRCLSAPQVPRTSAVRVRARWLMRQSHSGLHVDHDVHAQYASRSSIVAALIMLFTAAAALQGTSSFASDAMVPQRSDAVLRTVTTSEHSIAVG